MEEVEPRGQLWGCRSGGVKLLRERICTGGVCKNLNTRYQSRPHLARPARIQDDLVPTPIDLAQESFLS